MARMLVGVEIRPRSLAAIVAMPSVSQHPVAMAFDTACKTAHRVTGR